jgi:NADPH:quinone reductase-like Zn-dependent oxidoreductase
MTFEEAATIPTGGINGWHFLKTANVQSGESVLIHGAGGSIGTYAVQIARRLGAEVTVVDSGEKLDMLRSIGADHVIDYTQEDFTRSGETYDVIIDVAGKSPFSRSVGVLKPKGRYILGNASLLGIIRARVTPMTAQKKAIVAIADYKTEDYRFLIELIEAGKLRSIIDRRYPLEQIAEAHRYVDTGRKKGNVVITVQKGVS